MTSRQGPERPQLCTLFTGSICMNKASSHNAVPTLKYVLEHFIHTFLAEMLLIKLLFLKILHGMPNSVDPDQTPLTGAV